MTGFDPTAFKFVELQDFKFPGGVSVFEYANHSLVDGKADFLRINAYLSKDGTFVTIWRGLPEPQFAEANLGFVAVPDGFDFHGVYTEELFKGWLDTAETAGHIIKALRLDDVTPHALRAGANGELQCDPA
jgi:hypothetical protein